MIQWECICDGERESTRACQRDRLFLLRIGVSVKQQFTEEEIYKDRDSQISAIEKTFEDAQKPVRAQSLQTANYNHNHQPIELSSVMQ